MSVVTLGCGHSFANTPIGGYRSRLARSLSSGRPKAGPVGLARGDGGGATFDERLFNDKMAGFAVAAFEKAARFKHLAQLFEHARTAAHHDPVVADIQRRLTDVVEQLFRGDQIGDAAAVAERLAGDGRIVHKLFGEQWAEKFIVP